MKNMMNKEITIVNFMALISSNVVGLVLAFSGMAYWSLAWQQVIFILVLNIGRYYYTGWRPNFHIDFGPVRKMFGFSVKLLVTNIINTVSNNVLTFVFGRFYPINDVGNYSQAYNWDTKANSFVANTVGQIAQPVLASIQDDKNRELLVFRKMLRFTAFLSFPLMFGLTLVSREFILITIHEKWIASVPLLQILCVSGAFMPIYTLYQNLAISKGRSDVYMWCNLGQVVGFARLGIVLSSIWHPDHGDSLYRVYHRLASGLAVDDEACCRIAVPGCGKGYTAIHALCGSHDGSYLFHDSQPAEHLSPAAGSSAGFSHHLLLYHEAAEGADIRRVYSFL